MRDNWSQSDLNVVATIHEGLNHYLKRELDLTIRKLELAIKFVKHKRRENKNT